MSEAIFLGQAITSSDDERVVTIIEKIGLDRGAIQKTVEAIPVNLLVPFLQIIEKLIRDENVQKSDSATSTTSVLGLQLWIVWLNTIFETHSTYLSSISDLNEKIGLLTEWIHNRVQNLDKFLQLQGKLELITQQMRRFAEPKKIVNEEPILTFDEC